jgi:lysozyme family protein
MIMSDKVFDRREALRLTAAASAGLMFGNRAFAQSDAPIKIFGQEIPDAIAGIKLPSKPINLVRTVASILKLEQQANDRNLPVSRFAAVNPPALTPSASSIYQAALPRLVTLVDRGESADPGLADQAGEILADVHAQEHVTPEALKPEPIVMKRGHNYAVLKDEYRQLFERATIRPEHADTLAWHKNLLIASKERYEKLAVTTKVPWFFIGVIHGLEASYNFRAHLHNGDFPLSKRTRQVPAGRPIVWLPPDDWGSSGKDALALMRFTNQSDWSLERTLYRLEAYNGFGYRKVGVPTPYLWSFTNHYERGKFVSDGSYSPRAQSKQCGAATILKALAESGAVTFG